jgi:thiamine-monophosphate kinase
LFSREKKRSISKAPGVQPDLEGEAYVIGRLLKPEARKDIIEFIAKENIAVSA